MQYTPEMLKSLSIPGLQEAIKDAEWRIGSFVASGGNKYDPYVEQQMDNIRFWSEELTKRS